MPECDPRTPTAPPNQQTGRVCHEQAFEEVSDPALTVTHMALSDIDKATLDLEAQRFKFPAAKEALVRELFDETLTAYEARVLRLMENPEAWPYAPMTLARLVRLRDARREQRSGGRVEG